MSALCECLVTASGLSPIFARSTMARACERVGINPSTMNRNELLKALPAIRKALETFLPPGDVDKRKRELTKHTHLETVADILENPLLLSPTYALREGQSTVPI